MDEDCSACKARPATRLYVEMRGEREFQAAVCDDCFRILIRRPGSRAVVYPPLRRPARSLSARRA